MPPALLSIRLEPKTPADAERLARALQQVTTDDGALQVRTVANTDHVIIGGQQMSHLESVIGRLSKQFGVECWLGHPTVAFKEALTRAAVGEMRFVRQTAGRGHYAHVKVRVHPGDTGSGYAFEHHNVGDDIPRDFINAADEGIRETLAFGVVAGYPIDDVRVDFYDGSYHETDSTDAAFRVAGAGAIQDAVRKAGPIVLEPMMTVDVAAPPQFRDAIVQDVAARLGEVQSERKQGEMHLVRARIPLATLFSYEDLLRHLTAQRGSCVIQFDGYDPCRAGSDDDGETAVSPVREPHGPRPRLRDASLSLPDSDWL